MLLRSALWEPTAQSGYDLYYLIYCVFTKSSFGNITCFYFLLNPASLYYFLVLFPVQSIAYLGFVTKTIITIEI